MEGGRDIPTWADVLSETPITHIHIKMFVRCVFFMSSDRWVLLELDTSRWRAEERAALKATVTFNLTRDGVGLFSVNLKTIRAMFILSDLHNFEQSYGFV